MENETKFIPQVKFINKYLFCYLRNSRMYSKEEMLRLQKATHIKAAALYMWGFPGGVSGKEPAYQCSRLKRHSFDTWVRKIPWRRTQLPTPLSLTGESHGKCSLVGYSPQGHKEPDTTEATQHACTHSRYKQKRERK